MRQPFKKALVMGLGYIGLPTATLMARNGIRVLGIDVSSHVVETVNKGKIHIVEPELAGLVRSVIDAGTLRASLVPEAADVFLIAVPTPFKNDHDPDLSYVRQAVEMVIPFLRPGNLLIIESTCPVNTTEMVQAMIYRERPDLEDNFFLAYCPERVLPGNIIYELENNARVIGGIDKASTRTAMAFYSIFVKGPLHTTNSRTAEMCKLVENSFRDVNIAFANELSIICDEAGIDVWELISLANQHPRVNILSPGTGVGGHCIAVDPWFLVSQFPEGSKLIHTARQVNNFKVEWVIGKIKIAIREFQQTRQHDPVVALMGLAFKANIDDLRQSPATYVAAGLMQFAEARYLIAEPNIRMWNGVMLSDYLVAYEKADIVVFLVAHRQFITLGKQPDKIELDFCGVRK